MRTIIIIGAGQLGSRHLQGVLKYNKETLKVYISDPSTDALSVAKERAAEVEHNHELEFVSNSSNFPAIADVVIVATNSNVREMVTADLLAKVKVKYLVLEKVLFQDPKAYARVASLLEANGVMTYVNHPRRLTPAYAAIAETIQQSGGRSFSRLPVKTGILAVMRST